jgi:hypothetical protein
VLNTVTASNGDRILPLQVGTHIINTPTTSIVGPNGSWFLEHHDNDDQHNTCNKAIEQRCIILVLVQEKYNCLAAAGTTGGILFFVVACSCH